MALVVVWIEALAVGVGPGSGLLEVPSAVASVGLSVLGFEWVGGKAVQEWFPFAILRW